jgi:Ca-activated chloride channel family protein
VGNEVNRPLLEQLAEDSGGLAAFVSRGDDFKRQAKAFRRKLMTPAVSGLSIDFDGNQLYDIQPKVLPSLYHGVPVRVYGRYRGDGAAKIVFRGSVQGVEFKRTVTLDLPREDAANPEIERMWAWHKIDRLLKAADRSGSRNRVINEIVSLGEAYSIVTEYTSFLVLENDAEYRRWKIERRNATRLQRDRRAQGLRKLQLEVIRKMAIADIGPMTAAARESEARAKPPTRPNVSTPRPQPTPQPTRGPANGFDLDIGTGPVGPLFLVLAGWMARRKRQAA